MENIDTQIITAEYDKKAYRKLKLKTGGLIGLLVSLPYMALWYAGMMIVPIFVILYFAVVYLGGFRFYTQQARQIVDPTTRNGFSFGQGYKFVIQSALIGGGVSAILMLIFSYTGLSDNFFQIFIGMSTITEIPELHGADAQTQELFINLFRYLLFPFSMAFGCFFAIIFWSSLAGLVTSSMLKRYPNK